MWLRFNRNSVKSNSDKKISSLIEIHFVFETIQKFWYKVSINYKEFTVNLQINANWTFLCSQISLHPKMIC